MSTLDARRLYALLPAIYRIRDEAQGRPLQGLVSLIAREFEALEENIEQLYDDQFIETCQEWVAPYIGDLLGYRPLHGVAAAVSTPRAEVANTVAHRRRKGTAAMLEQLARDVTDWPAARSTEFFEQLVTTQYMNHVRLHPAATADLRAAQAMRQAGGAFNAAAHTAEMRRPETGGGRYNIPNIGIFLWRLRPFALSNVPLTPDATDPARKFRFNPLGADQALFRSPIRDTKITHIAEAANVPDPIDLRGMARALRAAATDPTVIHDYGRGKSLVLLRPGASPGVEPTAIPAAGICICDLRDVAGGWAHEAALEASMIAIDPRLGRVLLGSAVTGPLHATFHSGFSRAIGGGEYERAPSNAPTGGVERSARGSEPLQGYLDAIRGGGRLVVQDSCTYAETLVFKVDGVVAPGQAGREVIVAARNGARPLIAAGGTMQLQIGARGRLVLSGLVISGGTLELVAAAGDDEPRELVLRHCTLVPGLRLDADGAPATPGLPSLVVAHALAKVTLEHCIVGPLHVDQAASVALLDCIVDACALDRIAYQGKVAGEPGAELTIEESTMIGKAHVRLMRLSSDSLFLAGLAVGDPWPTPLWIERKQAGCMRFCLAPKNAPLPRHFHCLPDDQHPDALPHFTSLRYGHPGYAQLRASTPRAIREGASDGGEIGVMHALHQPQRETNLRIRLDEYLRFGLHAGIFYAT